MNFKPETVNALTISDYCYEKGIKRVDLIHMDVQGAEHLVIKGLGQYRPEVVFMETCEYAFYKGAGSFEELREYMECLGYILVERLDMDSLFILKKS
jgi:FkbM family methyltransferase